MNKTMISHDCVDYLFLRQQNNDNDNLSPDCPIYYQIIYECHPPDNIISATSWYLNPYQNKYLTGIHSAMGREATILILLA